MLFFFLFFFFFVKGAREEPSPYCLLSQHEGMFIASQGLAGGTKLITIDYCSTSGAQVGNIKFRSDIHKTLES